MLLNTVQYVNHSRGTLSTPLKYMGKLMNAMNINEYVHLNPDIWAVLSASCSLPSVVWLALIIPDKDIKGRKAVLTVTPALSVDSRGLIVNAMCLLAGGGLSVVVGASDRHLPLFTTDKHERTMGAMVKKLQCVSLSHSRRPFPST